MSLENASPVVSQGADNDIFISQDFESLGLSEDLLLGVKEAGFINPTKIQTDCVPLVLSGKDLIGQAQTGSGKTAAFVLPVLEKLKFNKTVEVMVLVPTRELAQQVVCEFESLGKHLKVKVATVVGGQSSFRQIEMVNRGAQIVVATPGRLLDHLKSKSFKKFSPRTVILDEADEMLDMGFIDDVREILKFAPEDRQTLMFSATMPRAIERLVKEQLKDPEHVKDLRKKHEDIEQLLYVVEEKDKEFALVRLIHSENPEKAIVFCRTRKDADYLCRALIRRDIKAKALHGDLSQAERTRTLGDIKQGLFNILVATDVASRGIDISELSHVFNFHAPENSERYTHRIGRTGRAGAKGKAITLASPEEMMGRSVYKSSALKYKIEQLPSKLEVQKSLNKKLVSTIKDVEISEDVKKFCNDLIEKEDSYELICGLVSYLQSKVSLPGSEHLGYSPDQLKKIYKTRRAKAFDRPRRSSSSRRGRNFSSGKKRFSDSSKGHGRHFGRKH